jgi:hypothetical protein
MALWDLEISHSLLLKQGQISAFLECIAEINPVANSWRSFVWLFTGLDRMIAWFLSAADISEVTLRWKIILLLPLVFFPVIALFKILYHLNRKIKILLISIIVILFLILPAIISAFLNIVVTVPVLASISVVFWITLAVILYWICLHRNIDTGSEKK